MKILIKTILLALICLPLYGQYYEMNCLDNIENIERGNNTAVITMLPVNLTGNFQELVVAIGFSDRSPAFPTINNNPDYPNPGTFPNGTLLEDYITSQGGSIPFDEWWEPALDSYFDTHSSGIYTVDFSFPRQANGYPYEPINNMAYFITQNGGSGNNVIWNEYPQILDEVAENMWLDNNNIFNGVDAIHFVFHVGTTAKDEFHTEHGGTINSNITLNGSFGTYFTGPISIEWEPDAIAHERMHLIGSISGTPSGFNGFPDRGSDRPRTSGGDIHRNLLWAYDIMFHNGPIYAQRSLYGLPPICSHDLIFLGWIQPDEILNVNGTSADFYLSDIYNNQVNKGDKAGPYYRAAKVMIHENFNGDLDEYFLVEYHNATEFNKNYSNYDEYNQTGQYNTGVLIWHIREIVNEVDLSDDNFIDLEIAQPYNGWYNQPSFQMMVILEITCAMQTGITTMQETLIIWMTFKLFIMHHGIDMCFNLYRMAVQHYGNTLIPGQLLIGIPQHQNGFTDL